MANCQMMMRDQLIPLWCCTSLI